MAETEKKKDRIFDLQETKGFFQLRGKVSGTKKDDFYVEKKTSSGKPRRVTKFRVFYSNDNALTTNIEGMERDFVYFSKRPEEKGGKPINERVSWADRFEFKKEGYRLMGCNIGVKKKVNEKGETVNDSAMYTEFDACKETAQHLNDDDSVFTRGKIEFSSFVDDKGEKKAYIKLVPNQVSLCAPIDFDDEKYEQKNDFNQVIVFTGIEKEKDSNGKDTGRFVVSAKIITYSTIEDAEFIIIDTDLAKTFKQKLKPYNAIRVHGHIVSSTATEIVEDDDDWGEQDPTERVSAPVKVEFIITGAKGSTVDKELYSEEKIEEAMAKIAAAKKVDKDFGKSTSDDDEWGSVSDTEEDDDEAW